MQKQEFIDKMKTSGIIGAGGAGFPTHCKLTDGIDTVLVNAVECEPLVYTDYMLLKKYFEYIVKGAKKFLELMDGKEVVIAIKEHTAFKLNINNNYDLKFKNIKIKILPNIYPMGDEIITIYQALDRIVPPGQLPSSVGVVVINAETAYNIHNFFDNNEPVVKKWITINGNIKNNYVLSIETYTSVKKVFEALNIIIPKDHSVIDGGPMMGNIIDENTAIINKKTKSLLILPNNIPIMEGKRVNVDRSVKLTSSACCQCTMCTDLCPRHLLGYPIAPHKTLLSVVNNDVNNLLTASLCSQCGICQSIACTQGLNPNVTMNAVKQSLAKNRLSYKSDIPTTVNINRDFRMVPSKRLKQRIGVYCYDNKDPIYINNLLIKQNEFYINLNDHIGKPAIPIVTINDKVIKNQMIAKADTGISAAVHSPINGYVKFIDDKKIIISTIK